MRQKPQTLLWYAQRKGFYYTGDYALIFYYISSENKGIYTGNGVLEEIVDGIMTPKERNQKQTHNTFAEVFDLFAFPVAVIPLDESRMRTLEALEMRFVQSKGVKIKNRVTMAFLYNYWAIQADNLQIF